MSVRSHCSIFTVAFFWGEGGGEEMEQHLRAVAWGLRNRALSESRGLQFLDEIVDSIARRSGRKEFLQLYL